jgi:glycosyltransferase involved in cell wall biosynthesis
MLRILHVSPYFAPAFCYGGPPHSILGLCQAQQRCGAEITVFTTTAAGTERLPPSTESPADYEGVRVFRFPLGVGARFFHAPALRPAIAASSHEFDLVHIHGIWNWVEWSASRACRRLSLPYVISLRGMLHASARRHRRWRKAISFRALEEGSLRSALFLHATSSDEAQSLKALALNRSIVEIPNGVDLLAPHAATRGAFRKQYEIETNAPVLAWIGRIHPIKRLDLLAAAFRRIRAVMPRARLVIAGPDESGYRAVVEPCFAPDKDAVIWTGSLDREGKARLLTDANLLVACSDAESFGVSIAEALGAGVPVVVTKTCPWPQVEQVGCGRWVSQDAESLAEGALQILSDPTGAEAMGQKGRHMIQENYSWDVIGNRMIAEYNRHL